MKKESGKQKPLYMQNEENNLSTLICQSCGMSMTSEHFGTKANSTPEKEYCCFCFKNGEFTDNLSLYEFATENISETSATEPEELKFPISNYELILNETIKLQQLKRWKAHSVHQEYYHSVYKVVEYINQNITNRIDLSKLSEIGHISKFHFHRIFKAILNESPGEYIQRLKLEKAAFKLHTSKISVKEIAAQTGYETPESLNKAFKKRYGLSPRQYRKSPSDLTMPMNKPIAGLIAEPEIRIIQERQLLCIPVKDAYTDNHSFTNAWSELLGYVKQQKLLSSITEYFCISHDISTHTAPDKCRIYACVNIPDNIKPYGKYSIQKLKAGKYATFKFKGSYADLDTFYCNIYRYWIPKSGYTLRDSFHFEKWINDSDEIGVYESLIEIYIPIEPNNKFPE